MNLIKTFFFRRLSYILQFFVIKLNIITHLQIVITKSAGAHEVVVYIHTQLAITIIELHCGMK